MGAEQCVFRITKPQKKGYGRRAIVSERLRAGQGDAGPHRN
jgi:hypothetical protein